jgi:hypothetical protein
MITKIPEGQVCQSFDPMMIFREKNAGILMPGQKPNTSCVAPAFVYIEGTHGKKFLCDFHYKYESQTTHDYSDSWEDIQVFIIDEREKIKETFAKNVVTSLTLGKKCYFGFGTNVPCKAEAFVHMINKKYSSLKEKYDSDKDFVEQCGAFYCNFHFRKIYYRHYSNNISYEDVYDIIDERYRMTVTIAEEALNLASI